MTDTELLTAYEKRHSLYLKSIAQTLAIHLADHLSSEPRIDRVTARAKNPQRFADKAMKTENGMKKYNDPLNQIQDQIGARIVTFYLDDVDRISEIIERYYRKIESQVLVPESESEFGYISKHYILFLPEEVFDDKASRDELPQFFELQIKTLFQHAWSEASHDLSYKPEESLTPLQKRQIAFTAAQAWGADKVFQDVYRELSYQHSHN